MRLKIFEEALLKLIPPVFKSKVADTELISASGSDLEVGLTYLQGHFHHPTTELDVSLTWAGRKLTSVPNAY